MSDPTPTPESNPPPRQEETNIVYDASTEVPPAAHRSQASTRTMPPRVGRLGPADEPPADLRHHPRYRILGFLSAGGMGTVYRAEHRLMERVVALKVINPGLLDRADMVARFRQEMRAAARLAHPNIVTAYDAGQAGRTHFLILEFVEGTNLDQVLADQGQLPVDRACDYARQVALGLQHAFERGMVHRDIKPHNLMLTPQGVVKILDFGLARYVSESLPADLCHGPPAAGPAARPVEDNPASRVRPDPGLTCAYTAVGTGDYLAPEVARDARHADIRADLYSLGCTLYRFLAGRVPFPGGTFQEKLRAHLECEPDPVAAARGELPQGLLRVVERLMDKDPTRRYQTPREVAAALTAYTGAPLGRVLVIDDDAASRSTLQLILERDGYTVSSAGDGRQALELLRGGLTPDVILLDLLMPVMNGWQFLEELRRDAALTSIPVIVVSALDPVQTRAALLGAIDYLHKPVDLDELAAKVQSQTRPKCEPGAPSGGASCGEALSGA